MATENSRTLSPEGDSKSAEDAIRVVGARVVMKTTLDFLGAGEIHDDEDSFVGTVIEVAPAGVMVKWDAHDEPRPLAYEEVELAIWPT